MAHSTLRKSSRNRDRMATLSGPRRNTINAILGYSKALRVVQAPPVGPIQVVLN